MSEDTPCCPAVMLLIVGALSGAIMGCGMGAVLMWMLR